LADEKKDILARIGEIDLLAEQLQQERLALKQKLQKILSKPVVKKLAKEEK